MHTCSHQGSIDPGDQYLSPQMPHNSGMPVVTHVSAYSCRFCISQVITDLGQGCLTILQHSQVKEFRITLLVLYVLHLKFGQKSILCVSFVFRLQDKVRETIEALRMAGIKVWVLTGDKHETAVSVSLSCGHFHRTMNILELLNQKSDSECAEKLGQLARR